MTSDAIIDSPVKPAIMPPHRSVRDRFSRDQWAIGIVDQSIQDIVQRGVVGEPRWLSGGSPWTMLADPAAIQDNRAGVILFAERWNHWSERGEIWCGHLDTGPGPLAAELKPWIGSWFHLSYPAFLTVDDTLFFLMEAGEAGELAIYRMEDDAFVRIGGLLPQAVIDPTIVFDGGRWWLFCTLRNDEPNARLYLYHAADITGPWIPHKANPVKTSLADARPGGPIFRMNGALIRPAQDCSVRYGGRLVLNRIDVLSEDCFVEEAVRVLPPFPARPDGIHTICGVGDKTIIDGNIQSFAPADVIRKFVSAAAVRLRGRLRRGRSLPESVPIPLEITRGR